MNLTTITNLTTLQDGINEFITENWKEKRTELDFMVASHMEMSELIDTEYTENNVKHSVEWKWWKGKNGGRTMDSVDWENLHPKVTDNIKIELTDLVFFTLSQKILNDLTSDDEQFEVFTNDWITFMSITANNLLQRPGMALKQILSLASKLNFNVAAYYMAKHLLNYYRQISNYGVGYEKIKNGKEDNELLHDIIMDITVEDIENNFEGTYNLIAERFFKIFIAPKEKEITFDFWSAITIKQ